jgi:hypothetical protein
LYATIDSEFDSNLWPRERRWRLPWLALRERSADHPMIMFFMVVATAFIAMALVPPSGAALSSLRISEAAKTGPAATGTLKTVGLSEIEIACQGQAWGDEGPGCLATIAKDSGRPDGHRVRVIAGA